MQIEQRLVSESVAAGIPPRRLSAASRRPSTHARNRSKSVVDYGQADRLAVSSRPHSPEPRLEARPVEGLQTLQVPVVDSSRRAGEANGERVDGGSGAVGERP